MKYKKLIVSLIVALGLTSVSGFTNVHAMVSPTEARLKSTLVHSYWGARRDEINNATEFQQAKALRASDIQNKREYGTAYPTYNQIFDSQEHSLSKLYPHGRWNGLSDIKGHGNNSKLIRAINRLKRKDNWYKRQIKIINRQSKRQRRWAKSHSTSAYGFKIAPSNNFSKSSYMRAFINPDIANFNHYIGVTSSSYRTMMRNVKDFKDYRISKIINPDREAVFTKIVEIPKYSTSPVYKIKCRNRTYYYDTDLVSSYKYSTSISPYNTEVIGRKNPVVDSIYNPHDKKHIVLKRGTKIRQGTTWSPNLSQTYTLKGHTWKRSEVDNPDFGNY